MNGRHRSGGLTLIELLAVIATAVFVMLFAIPALQDFLRDNRLAAATNRFTSSLQFARAEALVRHVTVRVCKLGNPGAALPQCSNGPQGYEQGWIIYADPSPQDFQPNQIEDVLHVSDGEADINFSIRGNSNVAQQIAFAATGITVGTPNGLGNGTIVLCDARGWADKGRYARVVIISTPGRIRVLTGDASTVTSC